MSRLFSCQIGWLASDSLSYKTPSVCETCMLGLGLLKTFGPANCSFLRICRTRTSCLDSDVQLPFPQLLIELRFPVLQCAFVSKGCLDIASSHEHGSKSSYLVPAAAAPWNWVSNIHASCTTKHTIRVPTATLPMELFTA